MCSKLNNVTQALGISKVLIMCTKLNNVTPALGISKILIIFMSRHGPIYDHVKHPRLWQKQVRTSVFTAFPKCIIGKSNETLPKLYLESAFLLNVAAVTQRCFTKRVFLKVSQNSGQNTCVGVSVLTKIKFCNTCFNVIF